MKILLVQPLQYLSNTGGAHKANRILTEGLARRGHTCWVVSPLLERRDEDRDQAIARVQARGAVVFEDALHHVGYQLNQVTVFASSGSELASYTQLLFDVIERLDPDWLIVSEDLSFISVSLCLEARPARVIYLSHSQATLPFGPECFAADRHKTNLLRRAAGIIVVSRYLQVYVQQWGEMQSEVLRFPSYSSGPFPNLGCFGQGYVTMINPCALKGLSIFVELARQLPEVAFAAVPTWGATSDDLTLLNSLPNLRLLSASNRIGEVLAQTQVLVVPSLWGESFGQVVVDAMLHGIPVLASDVGGIPEAKLGVDYLIPVQPIQHYLPIIATDQVPRPEIPAQDISPWLQALRRVLSDSHHYATLSERSHQAANQFVATLSLDPFEAYLSNLTSPVWVPAGEPLITSTSHLKGPIAALSPERRALLSMRLKKIGAVKQ